MTYVDYIFTVERLDHDPHYGAQATIYMMRGIAAMAENDTNLGYDECTGVIDYIYHTINGLIERNPGTRFPDWRHGQK